MCWKACVTDHALESVGTLDPVSEFRTLETRETREIYESRERNANQRSRQVFSAHEWAQLEQRAAREALERPEEIAAQTAAATAALGDALQVLHSYKTGEPRTLCSCNASYAFCSNRISWRETRSPSRVWSVQASLSLEMISLSLSLSLSRERSWRCRERGVSKMT